jgi:hypothetical protein
MTAGDCDGTEYLHEFAQFGGFRLYEVTANMVSTFVKSPSWKFNQIKDLRSHLEVNHDVLNTGDWLKIEY